jgi:two-component system chemotaxis response regulator CheB
VPVLEARSGEAATPGKIWIAPGDHHMLVKRFGPRVEIHTNQAPRENSCRPSADVLFRSAAEVYGSATLGVVMTGMGQDGLLGSQAIHQHGGRILVQDEASSVVWGMPGYVVRAGLAEAVVALADLAGAIMRRVRQPVEGRVRSILTGGL